MTQFGPLEATTTEAVSSSYQFKRQAQRTVNCGQSVRNAYPARSWTLAMKQATADNTNAKRAQQGPNLIRH